MKPYRVNEIGPVLFYILSWYTFKASTLQFKFCLTRLSAVVRVLNPLQHKSYDLISTISGVRWGLSLLRLSHGTDLHMNFLTYQRRNWKKSLFGLDLAGIYPTRNCSTVLTGTWHTLTSSQDEPWVEIRSLPPK